VSEVSSLRWKGFQRRYRRSDVAKNDMIEKVQRRFTKRLSELHHLSHFDRLQILGLQSLERRRLSYYLIILHGLTHSTLSNNLMQQLTHTQGHSYKLDKSHCSHDSSKYLFTNRIVDLWNSLPNEVCVQLLETFKYKVSQLN